MSAWVPELQPPVCDVVYRWTNPHDIPSSARQMLQRYRDNGELRFSLRSFAHVRGVRHFHVVAKGAPSTWLNISHPRISWWNETSLLEMLRMERGMRLPLDVVNSEPAKLAIARIAGLAERCQRPQRRVTDVHVVRPIPVRAAS